MGILSNKFGILRFEPESRPSSARNDDSEPQDLERQFRKMPTEIPEVLQISNALCGSDEECTNMLPEFRLNERINANTRDIEPWIDYIYYFFKFKYKSTNQQAVNQKSQESLNWRNEYDEIEKVLSQKIKVQILYFNVLVFSLILVLNRFKQWTLIDALLYAYKIFIPSNISFDQKLNKCR